MNLIFTNENGDILNSTIRDSDTGSVMYTVETPARERGWVFTTVTKVNRDDGSTTRAFRILWGDGKVEIGSGTSRTDVDIRDTLQRAPGACT